MAAEGRRTVERTGVPCASGHPRVGVGRPRGRAAGRGEDSVRVMEAERCRKRGFGSGGKMGIGARLGDYRKRALSRVSDDRKRKLNKNHEK